jgi:uncharacterized protein with PIN domain
MVCKSSASGDRSPGDFAANRADPTFVADAMLGRLAKWLRLLGFDTRYAGRQSDHQIAALARAEDRIVLTRDREMMRRKGIRCLYVDSQILEEQLAQVIETFGAPQARGPRCSQCNEPLVPVSRAEVRPHVPPYVWETQSTFHRCPSCQRIYWPGTHWQQIEETIARLVGQHAA